MFAWIGNISSIFGYILNFIYEIVGNYGFAIIIFTLIAKIFLIPFTYLQQKGSQKTTLINEEMKKIKEKYKGNDKKINEETLKLYKDRNTSPFAGCSSCLTVIFQMLIILAMFYLVSEPLTYMRKMDRDLYKQYEIRMHEDVIAEKGKVKEEEKTQEDSKEKKDKEEKPEEVVEKTDDEKIKELRSKSGVLRPQMEMIRRFRDEDEVFDINTSFLGLDLTNIPTNSIKGIDIKDPKTYGALVNLIIPVAYMIVSLINIITTNKRMQAKKAEVKDDGVIEVEAEKVIEENEESKEIAEKKDDKLSADEIGDAMQDANKSMLYIMPIIMFTVTMSAPLSLALYWLVNTFLTFGEKYIVDKFIEYQNRNENENEIAIAVDKNKK